MADETPDLSKAEQLAVLVRYVWNGDRRISIRGNDKKANIAAEAKGLLQNICDFEFVLALEVL